MIKLPNWLTLALCLALITSCQSGKLKKSKVSGYEYKFYSDQKGSEPMVGDFVYFEMDIYDDSGQLLQTFRNQKQKPSVKILDPTDMQRRRNPLVDIASYLSLKDSVGIIVPKDSVPDLPAGYSHIEHLEYRLSVVDIITDAQYREKMAAESEERDQNIEKMRQRLPGIEDLVYEMVTEYKDEKLDTDQFENGVKYVIHEMGTGERPVNDRMVTVQYYGVLLDTEDVFDNSFTKGRGYTFRLGRRGAIDGWDEVMSNFPVGTRASLFIPPEKGYGSTGYGNIPPDAELYFYIEIEDVFF